ncbi:MAG: DUF1570 domain-containing protein [Planctomycetes bacterium]|nr:DUF1570 domain-containing protein [Planctomycetota bacterium]
MATPPPAPSAQARQSSRPTARLTRADVAAGRAEAQPEYIPYSSRRRAGRPGLPWTTAAAVGGACAALLFLGVLFLAGRGGSSAASTPGADSVTARLEAESELIGAYDALEAAGRARPLDAPAFFRRCAEFAARAGASPQAERARALPARVRRELAEEARKRLDALRREVDAARAERRYGRALQAIQDFPRHLDPDGALRRDLEDLTKEVTGDAELALAAAAKEARRLAMDGKLDAGEELVRGARAWGLPDLTPAIDRALAELRTWQEGRQADAAAIAQRQESEAAAARAVVEGRRLRLERCKTSLTEKRASKAKDLARQGMLVVESTRRAPLALAITNDLVLKGTQITEYGEEGITLESANPKVRMPMSWSALDPKMAYEIRRLAYPGDEAESHYQLGRFCTLRDLLDDAQREFNRAIALDAGYQKRVPDLEKFRQRKNLFKGAWARVGKSFLRIKYDFARPNQTEDFRVSRNAAVEVKGSKLVLSGSRFFYAAPKEIAFVDEVSVSVNGIKGSGALPIFGLYFTKADELVAGYVMSMDTAATHFSVVKIDAEGGTEELQPETALPAGPITMKFANLRFELKVGGKSMWSGDAEKFSEMLVMVGGVTGDKSTKGSINVDELTMEGKVSPEWVRKTFSEAETLALRELEEDLKPGDTAPTVIAAEVPLSIEETGLRGLSASSVETFQAVKRALAGDRIEDPEEVMLGLVRLAEEAPGFAGVYYLKGQLAYRWTGDAAAGFKDIERALELAPGFYEARILLGRMYLDRGELTAGRREIERSLEAAPDYAAAYAARGKMCFREKRYDAAIEDLELAVELSPADLELRGALKNARHVRRGPMWTKTYEKASPHFNVRTDISAARAADYAANLEAVAAYYAASFNVELPAGTKNDVLIFDTKEGYQTYAELSTSDRAEFTLGYYHPEYRQLLLYEDKADLTGDETLHVLYHEGFHQFFDPLVPEEPYWLNEGLAEYYGACEVKNGKVVKTGMVLTGRLRGLKWYLSTGAPVIPFRQIIQESPAEFYGGPPELVSLKYAQVWAMIHFFMSGREPKLKEALTDYVKLLREGVANPIAFKKTFAKLDLRAAERVFAEYAKGLK